MLKRIQRTIDFALFIYFGAIGIVSLVKILNSNIDIMVILITFLTLMMSGKCLEDFIINIAKEIKNVR